MRVHSDGLSFAEQNRQVRWPHHGLRRLLDSHTMHEHHLQYPQKKSEQHFYRNKLNARIFSPPSPISMRVALLVAFWQVRLHRHPIEQIAICSTDEETRGTRSLRRSLVSVKWKAWSLRFRRPQSVSRISELCLELRSWVNACNGQVCQPYV